MNDLLLMKEDLDNLFRFMEMMNFPDDDYEKHFFRGYDKYLVNDTAWETIGKLLDTDKNGEFSYAENLFYSPNDGRIKKVKTSRGYIKVEQRKETDTFAVRCFFIDIDLKDEKGHHYSEDILVQKKNELKKKIVSLIKSNLVLKPSVIVESKNGFHIYYILDEAYRIYKNMTESEIRDFHLTGYDYQKNIDIKEWKCIENTIYCRYKNHIIETDGKVTSPMNLLRLPGSIHHKEGQKPFRVKIVFISDVYSLRDIKEAFKVDVRSTVSDAPFDLTNVDVHMLAENYYNQGLKSLEVRKGLPLWISEPCRDVNGHNQTLKQIEKGIQAKNFTIPDSVYENHQKLEEIQCQEAQLENSIRIDDDIIAKLSNNDNSTTNKMEGNKADTQFVSIVDKIVEKDNVDSYLKRIKTHIKEDSTKVKTKEKSNVLQLSKMGEAIKNRDIEFFRDKIFVKETSLNFNDAIDFIKQQDITDLFDLDLDEKGMCCSPFREDNSPSLHVSYKNGTYLFYDIAYPDIFSGSIIDIVMNLSECSTKDAILFCAELFNIDMQNNLDTEEYQQQVKQNLELIDTVIAYNQEQFKIVEDMLCIDSKDKKYKFLKKLEPVYFDFLDLWKERVLKYPHIDIFELEVQVADFFVSKRLKRKTSDKAIKQLEGMGLIKKIEQVQKEKDQTAPANKFYFRKIDSKILDVRCERMRELCKQNEDELAKKKGKEIRKGQGKINYITNKIVAQLEEEFK